MGKDMNSESIQKQARELWGKVYAETSSEEEAEKIMGAFLERFAPELVEEKKKITLPFELNHGNVMFRFGSRGRRISPYVNAPVQDAGYSAEQIKAIHVELH